jgi:2-keto-4-pentenoate hydratase/2-oxohepta-3-ene-1,7-dioic acid hydratase in catechol pathway
MKLVRHLSATGPAYAALQPDGSAFVIEGDPFSQPHMTKQPVELGARLAPVVPTQILGVGLNYRRHAAEGGKPLPTRPMWFMKTVNAVQDPGGPIQLPASSNKVDYEGELAVVIGRNVRDVSPVDALRCVAGYTIANDVSARDWQFDWGGGQFCHAKSFDTFCPLGPTLVTSDELTDPHRLRLTTHVNGELRQQGTTADLVFDVPALISFLSRDRTLLAGTVILTGTPHGVGYARQPPLWLRRGDVVSIEIKQIGILTNSVA